MKKLAIGLCLFVGIICRSEAQLDGEYTYTYDLLKTFNKNFIIMRDYTGNDSVSVFNLISGDGNYFGLDNLSHNPKSGLVSMAGSGWDDYSASGDTFDSRLGSDQTFSFSSLALKILGKTYSQKKTLKPVFDVSSGNINWKGLYLFDGYEQAVIDKANTAFKATALDASLLCDTGVNISTKSVIKFQDLGVLKASSSVPLLQASSESYLPNSWLGSNGVTYTCSLYITLNNLQTKKGKITGSAEISVQCLAVEPNGDEILFIDYPDSEGQTGWQYALSGTSKKGVSTLSLNGLGVIKGLKGTLYINESTQEIIQNGKNSITLYGQTIKC
jgi:hypothetical protein